MFTTIKYVLLTAVRDWLFAGIIAALTATVFLSKFMGSTVMVESSKMTIEFASGSSRIVLIIGMIVFVCFHVRRAFENKEIELMLSRPISRAKFVVSYWLGFSIVSLLILTLFSLFMVFFLQYNYDGLSLWVTSMAMEILIMTAFALFASIILRSSVTSVLLCFGFYIVSRMMGFFSYILDKHHSFDLLSFDFYAQKVIWLASYLLPRLDLFGQSKWLTYGIDSITMSNFVIPVAQSLIYIPILLIFAIIDFSKKQF